VNTDTEQLLNQLDTERRKFTQANEEVIQGLVDRLVELGVYPATSKCGYSAYEMVDGWGARWYIWSEPLACPECKADWRDLESGPPFKREIGIYSDYTDSTIAFCCPDCRAEFSRKGDVI
jgi:predicted Zn-ribbon and HTH transcriptional regulator